MHGLPALLAGDVWRERAAMSCGGDGTDKNPSFDRNKFCPAECSRTGAVNAGKSVGCDVRKVRSCRKTAGIHLHSPQKRIRKRHAHVYRLVPVPAPSRPWGPVAKDCRNSLRRRYCSPGTYSSGNCCRFSRHSLLIPSRAWTAAWGTCAGTKVILISLRSAARVLKIPGPGRRRFRKRVVWPAGEQASGSCGVRGRERRCVAVFSLSLRVIEYGG